MTLSEALSNQHIDAMMQANDIGKEILGKKFYSSMIKKLKKNGFEAEIEDTSKKKYRLKVTGKKTEWFEM